MTHDKAPFLSSLSWKGHGKIEEAPTQGLMDTARNVVLPSPRNNLLTRVRISRSASEADDR